jgi:enamine deaminase RidA (YjgF/YER057c/UK114 family)
MSLRETPHPEGLLHNPGFSQVVIASGRRTIYTAGQVAIDAHGALVGGDDLAAQTAQAMRSVLRWRQPVRAMPISSRSPPMW